MKPRVPVGKLTEKFPSTSVAPTCLRVGRSPPFICMEEITAPMMGSLDSASTTLPVTVVWATIAQELRVKRKAKRRFACFNSFAFRYMTRSAALGLTIIRPEVFRGAAILLQFGPHWWRHLCANCRKQSSNSWPEGGCGPHGFGRQRHRLGPPQNEAWDKT